MATKDKWIDVDEERIKNLRKRVIRDCRNLIRLDPEFQTEFLKKLEKRIWETRVEEAGMDIDAINRLLITAGNRFFSLTSKSKQLQVGKTEHKLPLFEDNDED